MNHDDLGNYSHTEVAALRASHARLLNALERLERFTNEFVDFKEWPAMEEARAAIVAARKVETP